MDLHKLLSSSLGDPGQESAVLVHLSMLRDRYMDTSRLASRTISKLLTRLGSSSLGARWTLTNMTQCEVHARPARPATSKALQIELNDVYAAVSQEATSVSTDIEGMERFMRESSMQQQGAALHGQRSPAPRHARAESPIIILDSDDDETGPALAQCSRQQQHVPTQATQQPMQAPSAAGNASLKPPATAGAPNAVVIKSEPGSAMDAAQPAAYMSAQQGSGASRSTTLTADVLSQYLTTAKDLHSRLRGSAFALERIKPVVEDLVEEDEIEAAGRSPAVVTITDPFAKFTCPVCMDDDVCVQDAFLISWCGHRLCRPCAARTVTYNVKNLQAQVCPTCQGTPCERCPITLHKRRQELADRRKARQEQRQQEAAALGPSGAGGGAPGSALAERRRRRQQAQMPPPPLPGDDEVLAQFGMVPGPHGGLPWLDQHEAGLEPPAQEPEGPAAPAQPAGPAPPKVKHCMMSQADMRLLLQPEEIQKQIIAHRAARKAAREEKQRAAEAAAAAAAAGSLRRGRSATKRGAAAAVAGPNDAGAGPSKRQRTDDGPGPSGLHGNGEGAGPSWVAAVDGSGGEEEEEELPPSYEDYLKAEGLRSAHADGLFKLCPKCGEGVELEEGQNRLVCPSCRADQCIACGVEWHKGVTCEAYQQWAKENAQADEEFKKLKEKGDFKECPKCGQACEKISGCDHVVCAKCRTPFCYRCGAVKTGHLVQTHGCSCMNGAAWAHDPRAIAAFAAQAAGAAGAAAGAAAAGAALGAQEVAGRHGRHMGREAQWEEAFDRERARERERLQVAVDHELRGALERGRADREQARARMLALHEERVRMREEMERARVRAQEQRGAGRRRGGDDQAEGGGDNYGDGGEREGAHGGRRGRAAVAPAPAAPRNPAPALPALPLPPGFGGFGAPGMFFRDPFGDAMGDFMGLFGMGPPPVPAPAPPAPALAPWPVPPPVQPRNRRQAAAAPPPPPQLPAPVPEGRGRRGGRAPRRRDWEEDEADGPLFGW